MEWALEIILIVMLGVTLFHALRLERALGVLKRDRAALEELVSGFNSSTRQAEQGIERLKSTAEGAGRQIARQIDLAQALRDDLVFLAERGERLADRLDGSVRTARSLSPEPTAFPMPVIEMSREPAARERSGREPAGRERPPLSRPRIEPAELPSDDSNPRLRSQAERDLLKALRMAR